jgi:hypothetical protein
MPLRLYVSFPDHHAPYPYGRTAAINEPLAAHPAVCSSRPPSSHPSTRVHDVRPSRPGAKGDLQFIDPEVEPALILHVAQSLSRSISHKVPFGASNGGPASYGEPLESRPPESTECRLASVTESAAKADEPSGDVGRPADGHDSAIVTCHYNVPKSARGRHGHRRCLSAPSDVRSAADCT